MVKSKAFEVRAEDCVVIDTTIHFFEHVDGTQAVFHPGCSKPSLVFEDPHTHLLCLERLSRHTADKFDVGLPLTQGLLLEELCNVSSRNRRVNRLSCP